MLISIDPNGVLPQSTACVFRSLGFIPDFIANIDRNDLPCTKATLEAEYGFPSHEMSGTVNSQYMYCYPNDPDLHPLAIYKDVGSNDATVIQYPYGIIAIHLGDDPEIFRMD